MDGKSNDKSFRRRAIAVAVVVGLVLLVIILRLAWFQLFDGGAGWRDAASSSLVETARTGGGAAAQAGPAALFL